MISQVFVRFERGVARLRAVFGLSLCFGLSTLFGSPLAAQTAHFSGVESVVGSGLNAPAGIAVDTAGNIYIADSGAGTVVRVPATDPTCATSGDCTSVGLGLLHPRGVAVDVNGNIYIADTGNSRIVRVPSSDLTCSSSCTTVGSGLSAPQGVTVDPSGNVYIADTGNARVLLAPIGDLTCATPSDCTGVGTGLVTPTGVALDKLGNVYVSDNARTNVLKVLSTDLTCATVGDCITVGSGLSSPYGAVVDSVGNVFIADAGNNRILEVPSTDLTCATPGDCLNVGSGLNAPTGIAIDQNGDFYVADFGNARALELQLKAVNLGSVNVGSATGTLALTFTFDTAGSLNSTTAYNVVTQGITGLDFTDAGSSTCSSASSYNPGDTCVVNVKLTPSATGTRLGAVILYGSGGTAVATGRLFGSGTGSQVTFGPGPQSTVVTGLPYTIGVAADASANLFVVEQYGVVEKATRSGATYSASGIATGLNVPVGIALDGSGNAFVATSSGVVEETPSGLNYATSTIISLSTILSGIAVDQYGNIYISDFTNNAVYKETPSNGGYIQTAIGSGFDQPYGIAVDVNGNLFIANKLGGTVYKETLSNGTYTQTTIATGLSAPVGVVLDASGSLYISCSGSPVIYRETPSSGSYVQTTVATGFTPQSWMITMDGSGNLYFTDYKTDTTGGVHKIDVSDIPSLTFASTVVGNTSTDSPETLNVWNIGNQPLIFTIPGTGTNPAYPSDFPENAADTNLCASGTPLAAGADCDVSIDFSPLVGGSLSESVALTDNALNVTNATQSITVSGTASGLGLSPSTLPNGTFGVAYSQTFLASGGTAPYTYSISAGALPGGLTLNSSTGALTGSPTAGGGFSFTLKAVDSASSTGSHSYTITINTAVPTLSVTNTPAAYNGSAQAAVVTGSVPGAVSNVEYNGSATVPTSPGTYAMTANFVPTDTTDYSSLTGAAAGNFVITQATPTLSVTNSPLTYTGSAQAASLSSSVAGTIVNVKYNGSSTVPTSAGTYAITADFTPTDTTDYSALTGAPAGNFVINKATPTLSVSNSPVTYSGSAQSATVAGSVAGAVSNVKYNGSTTVPTGAATYAVAADFVPTDTTDYASLTGAAAGNFIINKATPAITWATPAAITYGTALSGTQLNASSTVAGALVYTPTSGTVLGAGTQTLSVTLTPTDTTDYNKATQTVQLTVNQATPVITWATPAAIGYGTALSAAQLNASSTVAGNLVYTPLAATVLASGTHTLSVTLTPTDLTDYTTATQTVQITVNKATPSITWATPAAITYGTALSGTQLNASSTVAGALVYTPASGTVLGAGTQTLSVTLTPTDTTDYNNATQTVQLTVNQAAPVITWATPGAIGYGTALSAAQLNASSTVAGNLVYTPSGGTVLAAGTHTLSVTLTPTDLTDYTTATQTVQIAVNKATPSITWATPAAITYGTALSGAQLNASSTVAGALAYTPTSGTVLGAGTQTLSVTLTPTDTTDYNNATQTVQLTVNQAAPVITWATPGAIGYGTALSAAQLNASSTVAGNLVYTPSGGTVLAAGTHTLSVTLTPTDLTDYTTATQTVQIAVNKAAPSITWATPAAITYGTALSGAQLNASSTVAGALAYTPTSGTVLGAGTQTLSVTLTPTDTTDYAAATQTVQITVNKATPTITWGAPSSITFGTALSATQLNASSTVAGAFVYTPSSGTVLAAGTHTLSVTLTPTDLTDYITATQTVQLTVNQANAPTITWPAAAAITYGTPLSATQLDASTTIGGTFAYTPPAGTVLSAGTQTLSVTFTPTDTTDYSNATQTTQITVNKVTPTVTWTAPAAITYGTALSLMQLSATASVPGTFVYTPVAGTVLGAGTQTLSVTFTPTNATDYSTVTQTVQITVNKATPAITWTTPASITYGTALSATQLDATSTVAGAFVYTPAAGTVLTAGTHTLSVTLTPTDGADYNTATQTVQITVKQGTAPTISWATPAAITYGTALSATQLNASTTIPGTFVYTPAAAAVLNAGTQTLSVTFTPTDSTDYSPVTQTVQLTVNKAAQAITFAPPSSVAYGSGAITLSATGGASGNPITFSLVSGPAALSGTSLSFTGVGTVVLNANQAGNSNYMAATQVTQSIKVTNVTLTVSANNASRAYGVANPTFTGTITGAVNGDTFTEGYTTTATISSNAGTYAIVPSAAGTNLAEYAVVNQNGALTVTKAGTTTTLGVSSASINPGQSVTLTATVASATTGTPTGTVNFYDGTTLLGNGTLSAGVATYASTALTSGTHTLTAVYAGDTNFITSSTSASTSIVVATLDFTLAVSGASTQTVSPGGAGAYAVVVNPLYGNYAGTVTFTATNLPAGATATFTPSSVAANAGMQTVNVNIQTASAVAIKSEPSIGRKLAPLGLALLLLPLVGAKRMRRQGRGLSRMLSLVLLLAAMATAVAVTGCGGVKTSTTNPQTYNLTVTASSGNLSHSVNLTLDVQ